jgi:hypothetical protein
MAADMPEPLEDVESWILRRLGRAVEAGEVSADLLTEFQAVTESDGESAQEEAHAKAVMEVVERVEIPQERAEAILAALQPQPAMIQELVIRLIVELWLADERLKYQHRKPPT